MSLEERIIFYLDNQYRDTHIPISYYALKRVFKAYTEEEIEKALNNLIKQDKIEYWHDNLFFPFDDTMIVRKEDK